MQNYSDLKSAKVLITGGLGFIGSNLARRLVEIGTHVTVVDSLIPLYGGNLFNIRDIEDRISINISDVRDPHAMAHLIQGKDFLFNLAGQTSHLDSMRDPRTDLEINASSQLSILETCRHQNRSIKIIFSSTRQLYGRPEYLPVDEKHPINPVDINGINKWAGERYHLLYNDIYKIRTCVLRLTNTYGPGMRIKDARQTFLGIWIKNLFQGNPIQVFGDGLQARDFNYVDDVVDAFLEAAVNDKGNGEIYNLGAEERISLKDLANMMVRLRNTGKVEIVPFPPDRKAIDIGDYYGDFKRIKDSLGWTPRTSLEDGLKKTLTYYSQNIGSYLD